jgi:hypothetical protein
MPLTRATMATLALAMSVPGNFLYRVTESTFTGLTSISGADAFCASLCRWPQEVAVPAMAASAASTWMVFIFGGLHCADASAESSVKRGERHERVATGGKYGISVFEIV